MMIQLVKQAVAGDTDAFLELMDQQSLAMYKVARSILQHEEDTADAIQDTILVCFEHIQTLRHPEYFKTWMTKILINECRRILSDRQRQILTEAIREEPVQEQSFAEFEFLQMLERVEEKYRIILTLYYVQEFKISEIAQMLDMNENTVKTRLSRAREQIRIMYGGKQEGDSYGKTDRPSAK